MCTNWWTVFHSQQSITRDCLEKDWESRVEELTRFASTMSITSSMMSMLLIWSSDKTTASLGKDEQRIYPPPTHTHTHRGRSRRP